MLRYHRIISIVKKKLGNSPIFQLHSSIDSKLCSRCPGAGRGSIHTGGVAGTHAECGVMCPSAFIPRSPHASRPHYQGFGLSVLQSQPQKHNNRAHGHHFGASVLRAHAQPGCAGQRLRLQPSSCVAPQFRGVYQRTQVQTYTKILLYIGILWRFFWKLQDCRIF
jgi:hypothetical protein